MWLRAGSKAVHLACLPLIWLLLQSLGVSASAHHSHHGLHHRRGDRNSNIHSPSITASADPEDAASKVQRALTALAHVNRERVQYPNFNQYSFQNASSKAAPIRDAPPLDYSPKAVQNTWLSVERSREQSGSSAYSIPAELAHAASRVAESTPQQPSGNHSAVAAMMRNKYRTEAEDTNRPPQALMKPSGLFDLAQFGGLSVSYEANGTQSALPKRDAPSEYWMAAMEKNGASPFAGETYRVSWLRCFRSFG